MAAHSDPTPFHTGSVVLAFPLTHKDGKPWATLHVQSSAPPVDSLPHIVQGDLLRGSLSLDLPEETQIKSIGVSITGNLAANANTNPQFLCVSRALWPPEEGDQIPASAPESRHGKLKGKIDWPFSLELPQTVELPDNDPKGKTSTFPLPSSIASPWTPVNISYTLAVTIKHGFFLHSDHVLSTKVVYTTKTQPEPPSAALQIAYEEGTLPLGPDRDSSGWQVGAPVTFRGKGANGHAVEVTYTLALAKPLAYTRGGVIPLHLTIACSDSHLLGALSSPGSPNVSLQRSCRSGYDIALVAGNFPVSSAGDHCPLASVKRTSLDRATQLQVQKAVWAPGPSDNASKHQLSGEIHIAGHLDPTTRLGFFSDTYAVVLSPPDIPRFVPSKDAEEHAYPVEICTMYAPGPRPAPVLPPTYDEIKHLNEHPVGPQTAAWANFY
ncbi:hypothetical protein PsYK624_143360 [Phanerochaete sordida]|uniref:Arrestin-like N-terminal domain-containing protein n=1 Tax=Phanerochaete sordida TaxID=48140 RepID=A0A9P3GPT6_9APHY|nr:hypothetical protein PsYK624_143360 [Phanerochaete sordida]